MTVVALSLEPSWREPVPETERIIMVDFAATQGWVKKVVPSANRVGGQAEATTAKIQSVLPPPTVDGGGHDVPSTGGDPCHRRCITSEVCSLAPVGSNF
jgi:hypothetical protein